METATISVSLSRKINMGNYESLGLELGFVQEVPIEDSEEAYEAFLEELEEKMDEHIKHLENKYSNIK